MDKARARYVEIARGVGWERQGLEDGESDGDEVEGVKQSTREGKSHGGMGTRVSMMAQGDEDQKG